MAANDKAVGIDLGLVSLMADSGWRTFRMLLEYKADLYGRDLEAVSGWETASRVCSVCGQREGRKPLCVRAWRCPACGAEQDRDINAARNILAAGQVERFNGRGARSKTGSPVSGVEASTRLDGERQQC